MTYIDVFIDQYHDVYRDLKEVLNDLPNEALNWAPYKAGNSIAVLTTHLLGNQAETLRTVRNAPSDRVRSAEFETRDATASDLLALVEGADGLMHELTPNITSEQLEAETRRGAAISEGARTGLYHLAHSIVHAREHVGQIWMTRDLWRARPEG